MRRSSRRHHHHHDQQQTYRHSAYDTSYENNKYE
jgi:hypothetical protein